MRSICWFPFTFLFQACSTPIPTGIVPPSSLDAPLEFVYAEEVDADVLDSLSLVHDGIRETGRVEVSGTTVRFYADHGWFAGATYTASLDDVEPWTFSAPAEWHLLGETSGACGADTWDPLVASTIDGRVFVLATGDRQSCLLEHTADGYTSRPIGTRSIDALSRGTLNLADDGSGFVIHEVDDQLELVDLAGGAPLVLGGRRNRTAGALSPAGRGLVVRGTSLFDTSDKQRLLIRTVEPAASSDKPLVVGDEVELSKGSDFVEVHAATNDGNVRAVGFIRWDDTPIAHLHVAITRDDRTWTTHDLRSGDPNALRNIQVAVAEDGWVYATWHDAKPGGEQIWSAAFGTGDRVVEPARIDGGATVASRRHERLKSRSGHTAVAWLEKTDENQIGKVGVRVARDGVWGDLEFSTDAVEPYVEFDMDLDAKGNLAFTWENGTLTPCGARKVGNTWTEFCDLPAPGFTAPFGSVTVNARGRAYVGVYTGRSIEIAAFD